MVVTKRMKLFLLFIMLILIGIFIAYPAYTYNFCVSAADRNRLPSRNGEPYSMVRDSEGEPMMSLTRDNYLELCQQDRSLIQLLLK